MAAPNLPTWIPESFGPSTGDPLASGTVNDINNGVGTPSGTFIVFSASSTTSRFFNMPAMPSDFGLMATLNYNIRYKIESLAGDTEELFTRVWNAARDTAYTDEETVASTTSNIALVTKGSTSMTLTAAGLAATQADWDAALVETRSLHTALHGSDGSQWSIDELEFTGTYNSPPTIALGNPADAATAQSVTPELFFTGTDEDSDSVEYQVEVDTVNTFDSIDVGFDLKSITVTLRKSGTPTDDISIQLRSSSWTGTILGTSEVIAASSLGTSPARFLFNFVSAVTISANTKYWFTIIRSGATDLTNYPSASILLGPPSDRYSGGNAAVRDAGTWTDLAAKEDADFVVIDVDGNVQETHDAQSASGVSFQEDSSNGGIGQSFTVTAANPLISALSSVPDAGFTAGHPFASGVEKSYTIQAGDALANSTLHYWRARAIDPLGSNIWGDWSAPKSFTTLAGGGGSPRNRIILT